MIPPLLVQAALDHKIDLIAITDHNASANVRAVQKAAEGTSLTVLPGMEVQSREDVHLLTLFESPAALEAWQEDVDRALPGKKNNASLLGEQFVVDEDGGFIRSETCLLLTATRFSIDEIFERVSAWGGIVIPAHVDRTAYGLLPTLGLISENWNFAALEISRRTCPEEAGEKFPALRNYPLIQSGDVHHLNEFLGTTIFTLAAPTLDEIRLAFRKSCGRNVYIEPKS